MSIKLKHICPHCQDAACARGEKWPTYSSPYGWVEKECEHVTHYLCRDWGCLNVTGGNFCRGGKARREVYPGVFANDYHAVAAVPDEDLVYRPEFDLWESGREGAANRRVKVIRAEDFRYWLTTPCSNPYPIYERNHRVGADGEVETLLDCVNAADEYYKFRRRLCYPPLDRPLFRYETEEAR